MQRLTRKTHSGNYEVIKGCREKDIILKLAHFEDMYDALKSEQAKIVSDMEEMRSYGKLNTVTSYKQKLANKLLIMDIIGRFEIYGL